jgi:hypothetical protein
VHIGIVFSISFWFGNILTLASLALLFYWFFTLRERSNTLDRVLFGAGIPLHILVLVAAFTPQVFRLWQKPFYHWGAYYGFISFVVILITSALALLQVWLGLTLLFSRQRLEGKAFLGIIFLAPVIWSILTAALYKPFLIMRGYAPFAILHYNDFFILIPPVFFGAALIFSRLKKEAGPEAKAAPASGGPRIILPEENAPQPTSSGQPEVEAANPCTSLTLAVQSSDIALLKEKGGAFSSALSGRALYLQDRLVFQNIPIAVTRIEPDGPAVVTADTSVKIKGTEDPIILHCPSCGEVQEKMEQICDTCKGELPVVML